MSELNTPAVVILSDKALDLGRRIALAIRGELHGARARVSSADRLFDDVKAHLARLFAEGRPIVAVMASGAVIRLLAPHLSDKQVEPPVLSVSEDGASVVPLLGGHHGANDLARTIAGALDAHAAVTTAGDLRFGIALDEPPAGYVLANPEKAKAV
ncbi:MAG TPA: precorrin-3B C(17)-methyltransferase, partial [Rhizobium sp.]|nr:precorrin-3B C(17)-methyltransferase [Rhizobium sp.]